MVVFEGNAREHANIFGDVTLNLSEKVIMNHCSQ